MKFMLNGAPTLGTMDGANVEIVQEVGEENAFIFGLSSQEVINYENNGGYNPVDIYFNDWEIKRVVDQLMDGTYSNGDHNMYINLYSSLLNTQCTDRADTYFIPMPGFILHLTAAQMLLKHLPSHPDFPDRKSVV